MRFWRSTKARSASDGSDRQQVLTDLLDRNGGWIEFADAKAGAVLAFAVAVVGITVEPATDATCAIAADLHDNQSLPTIIIAVGFGLLTAFSVWSVTGAVAAAFRTLAPVLHRTRDRDGLIFFGDIAALSRRDWEDALTRASPDDLRDDLAEQVHTTAVIASQKHHSAGQAIRRLIGGAFPASLILYVVSHLLA